MKNNLNTVYIQRTIRQLVELGSLLDPHPLVFDSSQYWEHRYQGHGTSGDGSYGTKAEFKGHYINQLLVHRQIHTIIDYGVGDGNQLKYIETIGRQYLGLDVSPTAIRHCHQLFDHDTTKRFCVVDPSDTYQAELVMSNDVIYHLIDDTIYFQYMKRLFMMSTQYVLIHAVDNDYREASHVRFRKFTTFIQDHYSQWVLIERVVNQLWVGKAGQMCFYLYQKK
jgi:hypothetical protein